MKSDKFCLTSRRRKRNGIQQTGCLLAIWVRILSVSLPHHVTSSKSLILSDLSLLICKMGLVYLPLGAVVRIQACCTQHIVRILKSEAFLVRFCSCVWKLLREAAGDGKSRFQPGGVCWPLGPNPRPMISSKASQCPLLSLFSVWFCGTLKLLFFL